MDSHGSPGGKRIKLLPANAYTKLAPGEEYTPIVGAEDKRAEVTNWSILTGLILVVIFPVHVFIWPSGPVTPSKPQFPLPSWLFSSGK